MAKITRKQFQKLVSVLNELNATIEDSPFTRFIQVDFAKHIEPISEEMSMFIDRNNRKHALTNTTTGAYLKDEKGNLQYNLEKDDARIKEYQAFLNEEIEVNFPKIEFDLIKPHKLSYYELDAINGLITLVPNN